MTADDFTIACQSDCHGGKWLVVRNADRRIMTEGDVITCLRWVDVWAAVMGSKRGRELSPRFMLP
jgi:hypothetical protein